MANANGQVLFSEEKGDGIFKTENLEKEISKIELSVTDAEINIYGQKETSYVEFENFRENYYKFSNANKTFYFKETPDMISMLKFWENGSSFKGMRHIFNFKKDLESKKVINVYLSNDMKVNVFNISGDNCTVNLYNMNSASDYNIKVNHAIINATDLETTSTFRVEGNYAKLEIGSLKVNTFEVTASTAELKVSSFRANKAATITADSGTIDLTTPQKITDLNLDLSTKTGAILLNNYKITSLIHQQSNGHDMEGLIKIATDSAEISIRQNSMSSTAPATTNTPEETENVQ